MRYKSINLVIILIVGYLVLGCGHKTMPTYNNNLKEERK